jgi:glycosyltransferase involved in cell wall biosynthesis
VVGERSPAQLARAVLDILDDVAWRERARHAGPEFISQRFNGDCVLKELVKIYGCSEQAA